ncbi:MAG: D-alanyl-D-alanine endopeptidase [Pseudomonadales bacterium]|jgi:D-alanyl-D-alanine endopeptidase (penicillin-binding protein 7)|nr:D-alanyl-D-alanine endopeptidase [Pseudomonadales bacterium]MBP9033495.1 D-alanyl-D-alanine endopeptidase [Pseudomonadales bacterium]
MTLVAGLVCSLLACAAALAEQRALDPHRLQLQSTNAVVFDARTGEVLYSKNAEATAPIASITKLMTAMVVLDARQPMEEMLSISKEDVDRLKGTYSRLQIGTRQSRKEMLRLALMSSENRAASALGRHYPGGRAAFVAQMNRKATALRMSHTHFDDTTGLSSRNLSSAGDLVKMTQAASQYALIREFTTTPERTVMFPQPRYSLGFVNTNRLVRAGSWDIELSKTGYTNEAGRCLVMKTRVGDRPMVMVLLNSQGKLTPVGDATRIRQWLETSNYLAIARRTTSA